MGKSPSKLRRDFLFLYSEEIGIHHALKNEFPERAFT